MRDPFSWSFPLARLFGVTIRVHFLFPVVAIGLILRVAFRPEDKPLPPDSTADAALLMALLFLIVLLHEFGHCFAARWVNGEAREIIVWPLGGLAGVELPHRARAHLVTAVGGPAVNLLLCALSGLVLLWFTSWDARPPLNPLWYPYRTQHLAELTHWNGAPLAVDVWPGALAARIFWLNWVLVLLNMLPAMPLDGGRMAQAILWPRIGFRSSMVFAIYAGILTALVVGVVAIASNEVLSLALALWVFYTNQRHLVAMESGGEESVLGYDFSQGYTSLEESRPSRRRQGSLWRRWMQARASRRLQREQERQQSEERRLDELLEKVQHVGWNGLTEEERSFLKRVSDRFRNRQ